MNELQQAYGRAVDALNRGAWRQAFDVATQLLPRTPTHAGVHFVAGVAALQLQAMPQALGHLREAVRLNPQRADYATQLARALTSARLTRQAVAAADAAYALAPADPLTLDTLGVVYTQANQHGRAAELFRKAAVLVPDRASYQFNLASSLTFEGDIDGAERAYEACLALDSKYWKAHLALAQLRKRHAGDNHLPRLRALLGQVTADAAGLMYLNLALAKELEDMEEFPESFRHLSAGKAAGRLGRNYAIERDEAMFDAVLAASPEAGGEAMADGFQSDEPIFVIGMPRSGTTLVDRILSSHPAVHSAGELQNFGVLLKRASGSRTAALLDADTMARAAGVDFSKLGEAYLASTRPDTGKTAHFVDKLPHNFLYAGLIARALPKARIICVRRNPMDTCLGNFRQLFAQTSPYYDYSFDLLDTGRYFIRFDRLMEHWKRTLPGRIVDIGYEQLVEDQDGVTRHLLAACGLPWDEACLRFEQNSAPVATASAVQVRSPMFRSSMQRWKRYEPQLRGLRELLEGAGIQA
ncbi:MAG: sulfotransferase family protein [Lysobacteraceae bacterium]|nr:MAG: sulfotransferase family protein [Xanthomonadaceae bacterium]